MKLLMTTDTVGGVWSYTMELCAALEDHGVKIELASMGRKLSPEQAREIEALDHVRIHESEYRLCWMHNPWRDVECAGRWLLGLEKKLSPDLVHLNDLGHGGLPWQAPVVLVGHSCVYSWWEAVKKRLPSPGDWQRYRSVASASVRQADWLVAPSRAMLRSLLHYYGPAQVSMVIPNGRSYPPLAHGPTYQNVEATPSSPKNPRLAEKGKSPDRTSPGDGGPVIFAAGRIWDEAKNIAMLMEIAQFLPWPVYVAGEDAEPGEPRTGEANTEASVHYLGFLGKQEVASWLRRSAIYVAPAYYEPFGLGILEAARAGCALVLGDIPSLREVWADAAEYLPPDNPDALRKALCRLARNPGQRRYLADRAWQRAQAYSSERMAIDYMQCYRTLTQSPNQAASRRVGRKMAGAKP